MKRISFNIDEQDEATIDFFVSQKRFANSSFAIRHFMKNGLADYVKLQVTLERMKGNGGGSA